MAELIQILNGGIGVALVAGVFAIIQATMKSKSDQKVASTKITDSKFEELIEKIDKLEVSVEKQRRASLAILNDRITFLIGVYITKGFVTIAEHQNLTIMYTEYKETGGNGTITALMDNFKLIPIK